MNTLVTPQQIADALTILNSRTEKHFTESLHRHGIQMNDHSRQMMLEGNATGKMSGTDYTTPMHRDLHRVYQNLHTYLAENVLIEMSFFKRLAVKKNLNSTLLDFIGQAHDAQDRDKIDEGKSVHYIDVSGVTHGDLWKMYHYACSIVFKDTGDKEIHRAHAILAHARLTGAPVLVAA